MSAAGELMSGGRSLMSGAGELVSLTRDLTSAPRDASSAERAPVFEAPNPTSGVADLAADAHWAHTPPYRVIAGQLANARGFREILTTSTEIELDFGNFQLREGHSPFGVVPRV
jgi:hypothetical protein